MNKQLQMLSYAMTKMDGAIVRLENRVNSLEMENEILRAEIKNLEDLRFKKQ